MEWGQQQAAAIKAAVEWFKNRNGQQIFRIFGFAGTGKTTIAKEIAAILAVNAAYAAFTGKAALVLRMKGCDGASTIHSLIYTLERDKITGKRVFVKRRVEDLSAIKLFIIDEVSMVGNKLAEDLLSFGIPVLVLGDPAQLPPVKDEGYFIAGKPDVMLTEIHRQAAENPIIRMSIDIREGRGLKAGTYGDSVVVSRHDRRSIDLTEQVIKADQVICGLNKTRVLYNSRIRSLKGLSGSAQEWYPTKGDRLICLRNKHDMGLFNGGIWTADHVVDTDPLLRITALSNDEEREPVEVRVFEQFFRGRERELEWKQRRIAQEFTFGFAVTCHKSQGSQWDWPLIFDESESFGEHSRNWLYTAVTRAAEKVTVVL